MSVKIITKSASIFLFIILIWNPAPSWAVQGQWGGFFYLYSKPGADFSAKARTAAAQRLNEIGKKFHNDFNPQKGQRETIHYYRTESYLLYRQPVDKVPTALIRVESMRKEKVEEYLGRLHEILDNFFTIEARFAVTRQLNYTDQETLNQLKDKAPKRGPGTEQPNAVVFPLSKTSEWWSLTQEKRQQYFFQNKEHFGKQQMGHNAIGFLYIQQIFRKLYHSRFVDPQQDFVTYFEYSDDNHQTFQSLLEGLRNVEKNPEWKFVKEDPIFFGKRLATAGEMLNVTR